MTVLLDYWKSSITRRYLVLALFTAILPLIPILIMHGHYTSQLIETLSGERVESLLVVSSNKMKSFLEVKAGQLESLADLPSLTTDNKIERNAKKTLSSMRLMIKISSEQYYSTCRIVLLHLSPGRQHTVLHIGMILISALKVYQKSNMQKGLK